jgi:hypothetical protein
MQWQLWRVVQWESYMDAYWLQALEALPMELLKMEKKQGRLVLDQFWATGVGELHYLWYYYRMPCMILVTDALVGCSKTFSWLGFWLLN